MGCLICNFSKLTYPHNIVAINEHNGQKKMNKHYHSDEILIHSLNSFLLTVFAKRASTTE